MITCFVWEPLCEGSPIRRSVVEVAEHGIDYSADPVCITVPECFLLDIGNGQPKCLLGCPLGAFVGGGDPLDDVSWGSVSHSGVG